MRLPAENMMEERKEELFDFKLVFTSPRVNESVTQQMQNENTRRFYLCVDLNVGLRYIPPSVQDYSISNYVFFCINIFCYAEEFFSVNLSFLLV